jgi:RNA polymerase sigma-32 factor
LNVPTRLRWPAPWLNNRDETALHELITAHERLAIAAAQKFRHYGIPVADLAQKA